MYRNAAIFELVRAYDHTYIPSKFHDDISNGSRVIVLTNKQTHTQTDITENNTPRYAITARCYMPRFRRGDDTIHIGIKELQRNDETVCPSRIENYYRLTLLECEGNYSATSNIGSWYAGC